MGPLIVLVKVFCFFCPTKCEVVQGRLEEDAQLIL